MSREAPSSSCTSQDAFPLRFYETSRRGKPTGREQLSGCQGLGTGVGVTADGHRGSFWGEMEIFWNWVVLTAL